METADTTTATAAVLTLEPFTIDIPEAELADLHDRLARTRFTEELAAPGDRDYGVPVAPIRDLVTRWSALDWRAVEARLNAYPQCTTTIDGQRIHFLHLESRQPDATPLLLLHGWPGTFLEFESVIEPLLDRFTLVIPSLPGFGFSGPTTEPGWSQYRMARAFAALMAGLGYERYGVHGNDLGAVVAPEVGRTDAQHVIGVHVDQLYSFPTDPAGFAALPPEEAQQLGILQWFLKNKMAYNNLHSTQPQNLAHALADSPAGLVGWAYQLFGADVAPDFTLENVAITWFTRTSASGMRAYWEQEHVADDEKPTGPTTVPLALAAFPQDFSGFRTFAEADHANIVRWTVFDRGGHYPAQQVPELLVPDLIAFFDSLA